MRWSSYIPVLDAWKSESATRLNGKQTYVLIIDYYVATNMSAL